MSERKETNPGVAVDNRTSEQREGKSGTEGFSRRTFLGVGSAGLTSELLTYPLGELPKITLMMK
jgi:hypothetical protein